MRRLASEGIRPLLPWAARVGLPTAFVISVLDTLHQDPTRYVTRSVANCLNDIAKSDPPLVIKTLQRWQRKKHQHDDELTWMTSHALRTLTRQYHPPALALLGFKADIDAPLLGVRFSTVVTLGETFDWSGTLECRESGPVLVTLAIHYPRASGKYSVKVFALAKTQAAPGQTIELVKRVPFRPLTTRTLYPGTHTAEIAVNGVIRNRVDFEFVAA